MALSLDAQQLLYCQLRDNMLVYDKESLYYNGNMDNNVQNDKEEDDDGVYTCPQCRQGYTLAEDLHQHLIDGCTPLDNTPNYVHNDNSDRSNNNHSNGDDDNCKSGDEVSSDAGDDGEYKCDKCIMTFKWKDDLDRHEMLHESQSHFPCEHCDKMFTDPSNLQRHIRSQHVGARCHACKECGKTFATSSGLKQHQHIHSSVKPFQCEVCLKAYTQFSNLCRHKRMHADCRQQIKCKDCGQAFSTVTSLSKHKRFCEGVVRGAIRSGTGLPMDKVSSIGLPSMPQPSPLTAASYMGLYGPRPPYPFYPPLGTPAYPMFPGHPLPPAASPMSPRDIGISPEAKLNHLAMQHMLHQQHIHRPEQLEKTKFRKGSEGSDGSEISDVTSGSDVDGGSGSEGENDNSLLRKHSILPLPHRPQPIKPQVPNSHRPYLSHAHTHTVPFNRFHSATLTRHSSSPVEMDKPFDLSKAKKRRHENSSNVSTGESPLDLTKKRADEAPRKTHIFGERQVSAPPSPVLPPPIPMEIKLPLAAYPPMMNPTMLESAFHGMDRDKLQTIMDAPKYMAALNFAARFPVGIPPFPGMHPMGLMPMHSPHSPQKSPSVVAMTSPMMKMDALSKVTATPEQYRGFNGNFSPLTANKIKERYACKFCGKVFPRSANLTRHLRTHTGEQPYKCKYCERSFSISSNLQRHVRNIHNKERPFRCPLCERCFGQQTNLDRHLKKHESEGPNVVDSPPHDQYTDLSDEREIKRTDNTYFRGYPEMMHPIYPDINRSSVKEEEDHHNKSREGGGDEHEYDSHLNMDIESDETNDDEDDLINDDDEGDESMLQIDEESPNPKQLNLVDNAVNINNNEPIKDNMRLTNHVYSSGERGLSPDAGCIQNLCQQQYPVKNAFTPLACSS